MRYMIIRKADAETEAGVIPTREFIEAMTAYNQEMIEAGVMIEGVGLRSSAEGFRVRVKDRRVTDGPFTETKELIAGFTLIEVSSPEEARAWALKWPAIDADAEIEVRRLHDLEDFGDGSIELIKAQEEQLQQRNNG